jgi:hypothetical protein
MEDCTEEWVCKCKHIMFCFMCCLKQHTHVIIIRTLISVCTVCHIICTLISVCTVCHIEVVLHLIKQYSQQDAIQYDIIIHCHHHHHLWTSCL